MKCLEMLPDECPVDLVLGRTLDVEAPPRRSLKTKKRLIGGCLACLVERSRYAGVTESQRLG